MRKCRRRFMICKTDFFIAHCDFYDTGQRIVATFISRKILPLSGRWRADGWERIRGEKWLKLTHGTQRQRWKIQHHNRGCLLSYSRQDSAPETSVDIIMQVTRAEELCHCIASAKGYVPWQQNRPKMSPVMQVQGAIMSGTEARQVSLHPTPVPLLSLRSQKCLQVCWHKFIFVCSSSLLVFSEWMGCYSDVLLVVLVKWIGMRRESVHCTHFSHIVHILTPSCTHRSK